MEFMSDENTQQYPFRSLGKSLRVMREKLRETLAEVSGAVEIEIDALSSFEQGAKRPSEDILLLLISHFGAKQVEATKLWELAEYEKPLHQQHDASKSNVLALPSEARISYTDLVHTTANQYGVVINFMQEAGPAGQPLIISRVGMSKEHARSLIEVLKVVLDGTTPKALPAPTTKSKKKSQEKTDH